MIWPFASDLTLCQLSEPLEVIWPFVSDLTLCQWSNPLPAISTFASDLTIYQWSDSVQVIWPFASDLILYKFSDPLPVIWLFVSDLTHCCFIFIHQINNNHLRSYNKIHQPLFQVSYRIFSQVISSEIIARTFTVSKSIINFSRFHLLFLIPTLTVYTATDL